MLKSSFLAALILASLGTIAAKAQSIVDPGVSTHNYKHPNKAAKAKANSNNSIRVANMKTVESFYKRQNPAVYSNNTPKYAPRAATLVITRSYQKDDVHLNPLLSPRNYKTSNTLRNKTDSEVADYQISSDSTSYPTVD